jgi:hypothetical protein
MRKLIIVCATLLLASPAIAANYTDYTQPFDVEPGKTVGLWHFDEVTGSDTGYDATSNNNDAVIDPNAIDPYGAGYGPLDPNKTWAPSKAGFDTGTDSWLVSSTNDNVGTLVVAQEKPGEGNSTLFIDGDFSIDFWMKARNTSPGSWEDYILCKGTGSVYNIRFDQNYLELGWYGGVGRT